jgi:hypothetical protein
VEELSERVKQQLAEEPDFSLSGLLAALAVLSH